MGWELKAPEDSLMWDTLLREGVPIPGRPCGIALDPVAVHGTVLDAGVDRKPDYATLVHRIGAWVVESAIVDWN